LLADTSPTDRGRIAFYTHSSQSGANTN
jgi:hypothetical protein